MTTLLNTWPTLLDVSKQFGPDGQPLPIAELLTQMNPTLDDIPWFEANSTQGHRMSARAGLPTAAWRKLNGGIQPSKSQYQDVTEAMGMLSARGMCDKKQADLSPDVAAFRMNESRGFLQAMNNTFVQTLWYGDTDVNPERFLGLMPRFSSLTAQNGPQIIDAGGVSTDNFSIMLVGWGSEGAFGLYPKGSKAGLDHQDLGEDLEDAPGGAAGEKLIAYRDWYQWDCGIGVKDWRNIVRVANIAKSATISTAATGPKLIELMIQAVEQVQAIDMVKPVFYLPRFARTLLRLQMLNKSNTWITMEEIAGRKVVAFDGIPVRRDDSLLLNEARVV